MSASFPTANTLRVTILPITDGENMAEERLVHWEPITLAYKSLNRNCRLLAAFSVLAIIFEFVYFVCCAIPWTKMGVAEWAYWIGAIGTIGTLIGTIWLATAESRKRRDQSRSTARIYVAKMQFPMMQTAANVKQIAIQLKDYQGRLRTEVGLFQKMPGNWRRLGTEISELQYWGADELVALLALYKTKAQLIAGFQSQILLVGGQLTQGHLPEKTFQEIMDDIDLKISILLRAADSLHYLGNEFTNDSIAQFTLEIE